VLLDYLPSCIMKGRTNLDSVKVLSDGLGYDNGYFALVALGIGARFSRTCLFNFALNFSVVSIALTLCHDKS
jgi:hypothetical protein